MSEITTEDQTDLMAAANKAAKIGSSEMTQKVSKLLNQAERAPEGSPEREAFMDRAMALSQAYSIDLALARATQAKKEKVEEPEERQYQVGSHNVSSSGYRTPTSRNEHMTDLFLAVAESNDLKCLMSHSRVYVFATGFPSDHEVVERMFAILSLQMVTEADAALKRGDHKKVERVPKRVRVAIPEEERAWGEEVNPDDIWDEKVYAEDEHEVGHCRWYYGRDRQVEYTLQAPPTHRLVEVTDANGEVVYEEKQVSAVDGRIWRTNFYQGFTQRTRIRLREAKRNAMKAAGVDPDDHTSEKGLALFDKAKRVEEAHEEQIRLVLADSGRKQLGSYNGAKVSEHDFTAQKKGETAAKAARLGDENDLGPGGS